MDIAKEFARCIDAMSDVEFEALLAKIRPLREFSIPVDEYLDEMFPEEELQEVPRSYENAREYICNYQDSSYPDNKPVLGV